MPRQDRPGENDRSKRVFSSRYGISNNSNNYYRDFNQFNAEEPSTSNAGSSEHAKTWDGISRYRKLFVRNRSAPNPTISKSKLSDPYRHSLLPIKTGSKFENVNKLIEIQRKFPLWLPDFKINAFKVGL